MSVESIRKDMAAQEGVDVSINTVYSYMRALQNICLTDDLVAWTPQLRSRTAIRTSETRHLTDPAVAAYFLDAGPDDLVHDPRTFGLLFETMVVRDLRVYAQTLDGHVCHYRDKNGLEADAIVHLPGGRWGAVEVKLVDSWADEGARNLLALRDKMDEDRMKPPSFMAVVTADGAAYTREDGIHVIPLSCLRNRGPSVTSRDRTRGQASESGAIGFPRVQQSCPNVTILSTIRSQSYQRFGHNPINDSVTILSTIRSQSYQLISGIAMSVR